MTQTETRTKFVLPSEVSLLLGLVLLAFSVALAHLSNFGLSPMSSVPFVLSLKFTALSKGTWTSLVMVFLLLVLIVLTKKSIKTALASFLLSFVFGWLVDLALWVLAGIPLDLGWRILYYAIGFFAIPMGITLCVKSAYPPLPFDSFVRDLSSYYGWKYSLTKTITDISFVTFSILFSWLVLGALKDVGIGTIITAVFTGFFIRWYSQAIDKTFKIEPWFPKARDFFNGPGHEDVPIK